MGVVNGVLTRLVFDRIVGRSRVINERVRAMVARRDRRGMGNLL